MGNLKYYLWLGFTIFWAVLLGLKAIEAETYQGTQLEIETTYERQLVVEGQDPIKVEMASSEEFILRNLETNDVLLGTFTKKPLGWPEDKYYFLEESPFPAGTWQHLDESNAGVVIKMQSESPIKVTKSLTTENKGWMLGLIVIVWVLATLLGLGVLAANEN